MSVTVIDLSAAFLGQTERTTNLALRIAAEAVQQAADPVTPKRRGNLRRDVLKQVLGLRARIIWAKDYAEIQETKQFAHYTTAGTGPHFAQRAIEQEAVNNIGAHLKKAGVI
jgi:hypothetical protein